MLPNNKMKDTFICDMVIARYKEDLHWLRQYNRPEYKFRNLYLYNKWQQNNDTTSEDLGCFLNGKECIKINLTNEGRCDHTYLYHIIKNYDTLADVTIFAKGSSDLARERRKLPFIMKKVFETHDSVFSVIHTETAVGHVFEKDLKFDKYRASHPKNYSGIMDIHSLRMKPASPRPFGRWFEKHFPGINIYYVSHAATMAVSRAHIHQHPKSYYENFIKELEGHPNPEVGHYFERSWLAVFNPIPESCIYEGGGHTHHGGSRKRRVTRRRRTRGSKIKQASPDITE
jgi:hypothetical protein